MSNKWTGVTKPITAAAAEAEPLHARLFARPPRQSSTATRALMVRITQWEVVYARTSLASC